MLPPLLMSTDVNSDLTTHCDLLRSQRGGCRLLFSGIIMIGTHNPKANSSARSARQVLRAVIDAFTLLEVEVLGPDLT